MGLTSYRLTDIQGRNVWDVDAEHTPERTNFVREAQDWILRNRLKGAECAQEILNCQNFFGELRPKR